MKLAASEAKKIHYFGNFSGFPHSAQRIQDRFGLPVGPGITSVDLGLINCQKDKKFLLST